MTKINKETLDTLKLAYILNARYTVHDDNVVMLDLDSLIPKLIAAYKKTKEKQDSTELDNLKKQVRYLFEKAEEEGLYVGMGKDNRLPNNKQEGKAVKKLKRMVYEK